ncbi:hypothetical protein JW979_02580 [bacterium]|nr:hypothetical protein [candidate division CSSED10-310 bacterium]
MRHLFISTLAIVLLGFWSSGTMADGCPYTGASAEKMKSSAETLKEQSICPVMGNPINKNVYTDYKEQRIYFCCSACIDKFKIDPDLYLKKIEANGERTEKVPS